MHIPEQIFLVQLGAVSESHIGQSQKQGSKISRVALESLYRLLWVYIIRNSCEGNTATRSRLESICGSLFPRGNRNVIPRDAPLNIFVKIIHFIAQQKLDFAFKEIIFDLLGCNRASRSVSIYPERMNIGIRSLMVIADGLQQKDGPPGMPRSIAPIASGTIQRQIKKTYITRPLTAEVARSIGLEQYYMPCRKAFDAMLRTLDSQGKEYEDIIVGDVKPKLDLLRTCIAAVPRLLPEPMSHQDLIDMLVRMCVHIDEELRATAYQTLQNLVSECVEWREEIIHSFLRFLTSNIQDTFPTLLESTVRFLLQLLCTWRSSILMERRRETQGSATPNDVVDAIAVSPNVKNGLVYTAKTPANRAAVANGNTINQATENPSSQVSRSLMSPISNNATAYAMHCIEGFAIVLLCQLRQQLKKIAISMLKEVKQLLLLLCISQYDTPVMEVLDEATSYVVNKYVEHVSLTERQSWNADFATACEKICNLEADTCLVNADKGNEYLRWDPWACALSGYCEYKFLLAQCPTAVSYAWPALFSRLNACAQFVDPSNPQNESRGSLLRSSKSKSTASTLCKEALSQDSYLSLWQKYLVMCFSLAQPTTFQLPSSLNSVNRSFSPSTTLETADMIRNMAMSSSIRIARSTSLNCSQLFKRSNMLRWENMTDMRDSVVLGIGSTNPVCFELLLEELNNRGLLREAQDKKVESNVRRRKRKDLLRLQLLRVLEVALFRGLIEYSCLVDHHSGLLSPIILEFIDSIRQNVESDVDRDMATLTSLRLHFAKTVLLLINGVSLDQRKNLLPVDIKHNFSHCFSRAMCALNCCGSVFESPRSLNDEENLYRWLEALASYNMGNVCEETLCLVLHLNEHYPQLFEWTIRTCYTKADNLSSKCFRALAMLFSKREYPCEFVSLFVLCQVFAEDADPSLQHTATLLLQILRRQFLDNSQSPSSPTKHKVSIGKKSFFLGINQSASIINQLSKTYTQLTMPIFSEVCYRIESARHTRQTAMLTFLLKWLKNIELVDPNCEILMPEINARSGNGWGSEEATQLLLTKHALFDSQIEC
uniref:Cell morphogenesis protein N-terminal domain-containing protein n=1 Tax=Ditylenchus dipsaci TaxID=166011 RepID=A0A915EW74_9BILA